MGINTVPVIVEWNDKKALNLSKGSQYITVAKFLEDKNWGKEAWSVLLNFDVSPFQQGNPSIAKARFLVETAPHARLTKGNQFELYEGEEKVADVRVL